MKMKKRLLSLLLAAVMVLTMLPGEVRAEGEPAVIDVSKGTVDIRPDRYRVGTGDWVEYTGPYVLTGKGDHEVYFNKAEDGPITYSVTLDNMLITAGTGRSALSLQSDVTVELTVVGDNKSVGDNHPGIQIDGNNGTVKVTMTQDSRLLLGSEDSIPAPVSPNVTFELTDTKGVSGLARLDTLYQGSDSLVLATGTYHTHEFNGGYTPLNETEHTALCTVCQQEASEEHSNEYTSEGEQGHTAVCTKCNATYANQPHELQCHDISDTEHVQSCTVCDYQEQPQPHNMGEWIELEGYGHYRECADCDFQEDQEHTWDEGQPVETSENGFPGTLYTCTVCSATRVEEDLSNAIKVFLWAIEYGDRAQLHVYRNGSLWRTLAPNQDWIPLQEQPASSGFDQAAYLPYEQGDCYTFVWEKGSSDEGCSLMIFMPGETEPVFEAVNFADVQDGELVFSLNMADYTQVVQALAEVPENLSFYTPESVDALLEQIQAVTPYLNISLQSQVDGYALGIRSAIAALEKQDGANGYLNIAMGDLYITATGYQWGKEGEEIPYTGAYTLSGTTTENAVTVVEGNHDITMNTLSITGGGAEGWEPFAIVPGASVELTLKGENRLKSLNTGYGGLGVPEGASLHILSQSSGSLYALGHYGAAGIGGAEYEGTGSITIDGGNIRAESLEGGAGIGSGAHGSSGTIVINGGNIIAKSLNGFGAGIGNGAKASGESSITINGGSVTGSSAWGGAGIGHGDFSQNAIVHVTINGGRVAAGTYNAAAIGGGYDGYDVTDAMGDVTINGGIIEILPEHASAVTLGSSYSDVESENNRVVINGGSFVAHEHDLSCTISPLPKDGQGRMVVPCWLTVPEELANEPVRIILPDGSSRVETAVDGELLVFLPEGLSAGDVQVATTCADYSRVDAAITGVPQDLNLYTEESAAAVQAALDAVQRDLDYTQQDAVDTMAKTIEDAVAKLVYKPADYSEVDAAIVKAQSLNKENYKDFSAVDAAVNAVVRDKNITEQAAVDAMAKAINDAIDGLELKAVAPTQPTQPTQPGGSSNPSTGDDSHMMVWIMLVLVSGGAALLLTVKSKKAQR